MNCRTGSEGVEMFGGETKREEKSFLTPYDGCMNIFPYGNGNFFRKNAVSWIWPDQKRVFLRSRNELNMIKFMKNGLRNAQQFK